MKEIEFTTTSANHIANLAKEFIVNKESKLNNIKLTSTTVSLISEDSKHIVEYETPFNDFKQIEDNLQIISEATSFIAYLREEIKSKEKDVEKIENMSIHDYAKMVGKSISNNDDLPTRPNKEKILGNLSENDKLLIIQANAFTSVYGKYIHPDGKFSKERKSYFNKLSNPGKVDFEGRDSIIYNYSTSYTPETIDLLFFKLQSTHRHHQAAYNKIMHEVDEEFNKQLREYNSIISERTSKNQVIFEVLTQEFNNYQNSKIEEISNRKIKLPKKYISIYELIKNLDN